MDEVHPVWDGFLHKITQTSVELMAFDLTTKLRCPLFDGVGLEHPSIYLKNFFSTNEKLLSTFDIIMA
ncbi:MAG: hypothetical protein ACI9DJ_002624 [Algoriphagus sp.]|jgi:hypothetical protein